MGKSAGGKEALRDTLLKAEPPTCAFRGLVREIGRPDVLIGGQAMDVVCNGE